MTELGNLALESQLCFPLYAAAREVMKAYKPFLDDIDLTYTQYVTMIVVWDKGTVSVGNLGKELHLDSGTLTPLLKTLERKGLVERTRSAKDERVVDISPTPKALELKSVAQNIPMRLRDQMPISPEDAQELSRLLYKLLEQM